ADNSGAQRGQTKPMKTLPDSSTPSLPSSPPIIEKKTGRLGLAARRSAIALALGLAALTLMGGGTLCRDGGFVAHEWGTFTSVQGGDGVLLDGRPLETSRLPQFVYDWKKPGLNRRATSALFAVKGRMSTLQRMETPVIYFYADRKQSVDVSVRFPQGT